MMARSERAATLSHKLIDSLGDYGYLAPTVDQTDMKRLCREMFQRVFTAAATAAFTAAKKKQADERKFLSDWRDELDRREGDLKRRQTNIELQEAQGIHEAVKQERLRCVQVVDTYFSASGKSSDKNDRRQIIKHINGNF